MAERILPDDLTEEEAVARSCVTGSGSPISYVGGREFHHYETPAPTHGPQKGIYINLDTGLAYEVTATAERAPDYDNPDNGAEEWSL